MLTYWPGLTFLVYGKKAYESVRKQSIPFNKIQNGDRYGVFVIPKKDLRGDVFQLFGGEPILVINAYYYTYKEMTSMTNRPVWISADFPYWHHTFQMDNPPLASVARDEDALQSLCLKCFQIIPSEDPSLFSCDELKHPVCKVCHSYDWTCYHASHKREYVPFEDSMIYDGLENMEISFCTRGGCESLVNPSVVCLQCQEGGFCSNFCLRLNHEC